MSNTPSVVGGFLTGVCQTLPKHVEAKAFELFDICRVAETCTPKCRLRRLQLGL